MLAGSGIGLKVGTYDTTNANLKACIRAEDLELVPGELSALNSVPGRITVQSFQGPTVQYHVKINEELTLDVLAPKSASLNFKLHDDVSVRIPSSSVQILPSEVVAA